MENSISLSMNTANEWALPVTQEYSSIYINRPFEKIAPIILSPLTVKQVRLMVATAADADFNHFTNVFFHLVLHDGQDVIVSYCCHWDDFKVSTLKNLTGGYRIRPFSFHLDQAILDYTTNSDLCLKSYGLKISAAQKNTLIRKIVQDYWFYDKTFNTVYRNGNSALSSVMSFVADEQLSFTFAPIMPHIYLGQLKRAGMINEADILLCPNLQHSQQTEHQLMTELYELEKVLENKLLFKCASLIIPNDLGFSRYELIEVIRGRFELNRRQCMAGGIKGELELKAHINASIWLNSLINNDAELASIANRICQLKLELHS